MAKTNSIFIPGLEGFDTLRRGYAGNLEFVKNKEDIFNCLIREMTARTLRMFKYESYPETFSPWAFEMALQNVGYAFIWNGKPRNEEAKDGVYALRAIGTGGQLDENYLPTRAIGANPFLNITIDEKIEDDSIVWAWNDSQYMGIRDINNLYAGMLAESFVTLRLKLILHRAPAFAVASNEDEKADALQFFKNLEDGQLGVIGTKKAIENVVGHEGFTTKPNLGDGQNSIKEIIETIQYLYAQWYIKLGLNDNYNMKREALNSTETSVNEDTLYGFIESMFECRKEAIEEANKKFGTTIKVSLAGEWARIFERRNRADKMEEMQIEAVKNQDQKESEDNPNEKDA